MPKTFELQKQLKTLPLSNLNDASKNFLEWVQPIISNEQFEETKNNLENFMNNEGPILHKKLEEFSALNEGNWLSPLWLEMYLDIREPVAIDVNYYVKIITEHLKGKYSSTQIAGVIINKLMDVYENICDETFEPEINKNIPFCMAAYKVMFKATKIPKLNRDEFIVKPKTKVSHIIVMYKNHMFKVNLTDANGQRQSCKMIINTLDSLLANKIEANTTSMGLITTAYRDNAAVILEDIIAIEKNKENFETLKDALFMVCMDEGSSSLEEFAKSLIGSNENNRYFDKNLQLIFNESSNFGFNLEHTGADGGPWINVINIVNEELVFIDKYIEDTTTQSIEIDCLEWDLPETIKTKLNEVRTVHNKKVEDLQQEIMHFEDFGSTKIKSMQVSPDAFLHIALQLAQYRTFNTLRSTYEATSTRNYLNGRTECNRPISMQILNFVKAFDNEESSVDTLKQLLSEASVQHSKRIKACLGSDGVERYFYALKNMYTQFHKELNLSEVPAFFDDVGYKQLGYSFISSSRIESKYFDLGGFGPVVPDGYGFWYNLLDNQIDMNLIANKSINNDDIKPFRDAIIKSLNDLAKLASK